MVNINGRQRYELPIDSHPQYNNKTQEDFTSGIETRPGMAPPLWPPNQHKTYESDIIKNLRTFSP